MIDWILDKSFIYSISIYLAVNMKRFAEKSHKLYSALFINRLDVFISEYRYVIKRLSKTRKFARINASILRIYRSITKFKRERDE